MHSAGSSHLYVLYVQANGSFIDATYRCLKGGGGEREMFGTLLMEIFVTVEMFLNKSHKNKFQYVDFSKKFYCSIINVFNCFLHAHYNPVNPVLMGPDLSGLIKFRINRSLQKL